MPEQCEAWSFTIHGNRSRCPYDVFEGKYCYVHGKCAEGLITDMSFPSEPAKPPELPDKLEVLLKEWGMA